MISKILEIPGSWYIFEITIVNRQNEVGSVPKAKILEIPRNLYIFQIAVVNLQNIVGYAPRKYWKSVGIGIYLRSQL